MINTIQVQHFPRAMASEHDEQCVVVEYCQIRRYPLFAIPNGGSRNKAEAARLKAEGVSAGVPDLFMPIAKGKYHGLFIEMKVGKNKTSFAQDEWIALLRRNGYAVAVCYGADAAIKTIDEYIFQD